MPFDKIMNLISKPAIIQDVPEIEWLARALAEQYARGWTDHDAPKRSRQELDGDMRHIMHGNSTYMRHFRKLAAELWCAAHEKMPPPTPAQDVCGHEKWRKLEHPPRHCVECGLLMWDAGD